MFKLNFPIPESTSKCHLKDNFFLIGSCFSDEITHYLKQFKFNALSNPLGTLYDPVSIFKCLKAEFNSEDILCHQDVFYHWDCNRTISNTDANQLKVLIEEKNDAVKLFLQNTQWIILSLGTAYQYRLKESNRIVANCHKQSKTLFDRSLLSVNNIVEAFEQTYPLIQQKNIILTISPVRHIKDGWIENNQSKAVLILATKKIKEKYSNVHYFPSYEIMIDELRDYRFYKTDYLHPSAEATNYIWRRFVESFMDEPTQKFIEEWQGILQALSHNAFHPHTDAHQSFLKLTLEKLKSFKKKVDISREINILKKQLL